MRLAIWIICFGLLFLYFITAPSKAASKADEMHQYCMAFAADYPEALQDDVLSACFHRLSGQGVEL
jgi:hypothetical protein